MLVTDLVTDFTKERAGNKAFSGCRCTCDANDHALMGLVSHTFLRPDNWEHASAEAATGQMRGFGGGNYRYFAGLTPE
jgi:hypothetical protein